MGKMDPACVSLAIKKKFDGYPKDAQAQRALGQSATGTQMQA